MWVTGKFGALQEAQLISESDLIDNGDGTFYTDVTYKYIYRKTSIESQKQKLNEEIAAEQAKAPSQDEINKREELIIKIDSALAEK